MVEITTAARQPSWRLPSNAAIIEILIFIPIPISHPDTVFFVGILLVIPTLLVASMVLIVLFVRSVLGLGRLHPLSILATLVIRWVIPTSLIFYEHEHPFALHERARWLAGANEYKGKVLAQPTSNGEFRHIEWDEAGLAGVANRTVYLVFDPSDTLWAAVNSRRRDLFKSNPCEVRFTQRLESHWYSVVLDIDQEHCN